MRSTLLSAATGVLAIGLLATPAFADDDPNQGKEDFVLMVDNAKVSCPNPTPGAKHEDGYGETIKVWSMYPIDYVTVKSGKDAALVGSSFWMEDGTYYAKITLTKDVSNYVVWTCPKTPPTTHTTPPTTPPTTTHTTPPTTTHTTPPVTTTTVTHPPVTTTVTVPPHTTTVVPPPVTHTPPPAGGGYETPGVGAPDTGGGGGYTPFTLAAGTGLLLVSAGLLARGIRRREVDEG